ncbi:MAG TPA: alpha/beta hydrolase [Candidatus Limnocylindrales bacterium]
MQADLKGPIHYTDFDGPSDGPRVVYVHGLGGSHLNWIGLAPLLSSHVRATAVDLPGFGLTPAAGRRTTVAANSAVLREFLRQVVGEQTILVGNSMGGLISMIVSSEQPELVSRLVLIDPTLPLPVARGTRLDPAVAKQFFMHGIPGLGEWVLARRYARVPAAQRVSEVLSRCCLDPQRVPPEMVEKMIEMETDLTLQADHAACHLAAARSIVRGLARPSGYWRRMVAIEQPVLLLHGTHDRLVPIAAAHQAAKRLPHWSFVELEAGHIPQMEAPEMVAKEILTWLDRS